MRRVEFTTIVQGSQSYLLSGGLCKLSASGEMFSGKRVLFSEEET